MKSAIPHYYVNERLYVDYMEAVDYCDINNLSYDLITKTIKKENEKHN